MFKFSEYEKFIYKVRHPLPQYSLWLWLCQHKFTPITVSVAQEKFITEISIIGGAKPS